MLRHRRHDVLVFHVLDEDELTFPFAGTTRFEGMEELPQLAVRPARPARRLHRSAGRIPGRSAPRLRPARASTTSWSAPATISTPCCRSSCTTAWTFAPTSPARKLGRSCGQVHRELIACRWLHGILRSSLVHGGRRGADQLADPDPPDQPHALQAHSLGGDGVPAQVAETQPPPAHHRADDPAAAPHLARAAGRVPGGPLPLRRRRAAQRANHVVIVDDTPEHARRGQGRGRPRQPTPTTPPSSRSRKSPAAPPRRRSAQNMRIFLLSELDKSPLFEGRLERPVGRRDRRQVRRPQPQADAAARQPARGLRKGRQFLSEIKSDGGNKVLHFVSDFRDSDWTGPDSEKLTDEVKGILEDGVNLNLIDVAAPYRGTTGKVALNHDNLALVDLKADTRVAIEDGEVEFTATIMNYGQARGAHLLQGLRQRQRKPQQRLRPGKAAPRQQDRAQVHPALPRLEQARPGDHREGHRRGARAQAPAAARVLPRPRHHRARRRPA